MITIQLVDPNTLTSLKLSDFDRKQIVSNDFTGKSGQQINLINAEGDIHKVLFGFEACDSIWSVASVTQRLPQGTYQFETDLKSSLIFDNKKHKANNNILILSNLTTCLL